MKKIIILSILILIVTLTFAEKRKVEVVYKQEEVYVVFEENLIGVSPEFLKIEFALGGDLIFFKAGYYSQRVKIDPETVFSKLKVDLVPKPKSAAAPTKKLLKPDTLLVSNIVTNMTNKDIQEVIDENFIANNYYIGNSSKLFPGSENEIKNTRYKIAIEVVDSKQVRAVYQAPRFMMAYIRIRWSLLDVNTNKVIYFNDTEGTYFVKVESTKGMVLSDMMLRVMKEAIKEAQFKLLTDNKFTSLIAAD